MEYLKCWIQVKQCWGYHSEEWGKLLRIDAILVRTEVHFWEMSPDFITDFLFLCSCAINFLDLNISINEGKISTDLYKKDTSIPSALLPSSSHPEHVSKNIVFSMAFRLLRICSTPQLLDQRLLELQNEVYSLVIINCLWSKKLLKM